MNGPDIWDDHLDDLDEPSAQEWGLRKYCAYLCLTSVDDPQDIEDAREDFLDPLTPWTLEELKDALTRLKLNQRHPLNCYYPGQKVMVKHFRMICGL